MKFARLEFDMNWMGAMEASTPQHVNCEAANKHLCEDQRACGGAAEEDRFKVLGSYFPLRSIKSPIPPRSVHKLVDDFSGKD